MYCWDGSFAFFEENTLFINRVKRIGFIGLGFIFLSLFLFINNNPLGATSAPPQFVDRGLDIRYQDSQAGYHQRGRANVAADFDLDGYIDFYIGNTGDAGYILRNVDGVSMEVVQLLTRNKFTWGGVAFDYDNDGDYDLFVTAGGNEGPGLDYLYRNEFMETGQLSFTDVTTQAGVAGRVVDGVVTPLASANAVAIDYNQDALTDIFVNVNFFRSRAHLEDGSQNFFCGIELEPGEGAAGEGKNILWRNNGDGTFTDVIDEVGLGDSSRRTRHSTFFDIDNDGDFDLYEQNRVAINILWRNMLAETGQATFEDVTDAFSNAPTDDLHFPIASFVSASADFNNDGWEDLAVFTYSDRADNGSPYALGHALFMNENGQSFTNVADASGLNSPFEPNNGVMGCQLGDVNADGAPDVFIGNGGPSSGQFNQLFLSSGGGGFVPQFANASSMIDFPAPELAGLTYAPYPYRTHGTTFVDVNNDGVLEIAVANGGPARSPDEVREPNRLFMVANGNYDYLKVRPVGDGVNVSTDGIGTRLALRVSNGVSTRTIYRTLFGGSCFSAQNGFELHFGFAPGTTLEALRIMWPDGTTEMITSGLVVNSTMVVNR